MNTKEDRETKPPSVHYSEKYGKIEEVKNYEKKVKKYLRDYPCLMIILIAILN